MGLRGERLSDLGGSARGGGGPPGLLRRAPVGPHLLVIARADVQIELGPPVIIQHLRSEVM
jgi:hypothetical protein